MKKYIEIEKELNNIIKNNLDDEFSKLDIWQELMFRAKAEVIDECKDYNLSDIQKNMLTKKCPSCKYGKLHPVEGEKENYLWCDTCDLSMDSCGGYIN